MQMSEEEIHNFAEEARLTRNILRDDPDDNINTSGHNQDNIQGNIDSTEEQNQDSIDSTQEQNQDGIDSTEEQNQDNIVSTVEQNQGNIVSAVEQNQGNNVSTEVQNEAVSPPPANLLSYFKKILTRVREFKRSCTQLSLSTDLLWRLACIIVSILSLVIGFTAWEKNDSGTWSKFLLHIWCCFHISYSILFWPLLLRTPCKNMEYASLSKR